MNLFVRNGAGSFNHLYFCACTFFDIKNTVEDLKLHGIEALRGLRYLATGKHLCGPATGSPNVEIHALISC